MAGTSIGDLFLRIRATAAGLSADLNRDLNAARSSVGAQAVAMGNLISGGIQSGLGSVKSFITEQLGSAIKQAAGFEMTSVMFKVLLGDAEKAKKALAEIRILDQQSPLSFGVLSEGGKQLLAMGVQAEAMVPTLRLLGEVSLGNAERFGRLIYAFGQISSATKLMGTELRQLTELGFNPLEYISKRTGESITDLHKRMSDGKISFAEVQQAFVDATSKGGRFFGALEEGAKTFEGKMAKLTGSISAGMIDIGTGINDALKPVIDDLTKEIGNLGPATKDIGAAIGKWGTDLYQSAGGMRGIAGWAVEVAARIADWGPKFMAFKDLTVAGVNVITASFRTMGATLTSAFHIARADIGALWELAKVKLEEWGQGARQLAHNLKVWFIEALNAIKGAVNDVGAAITRTADNFGPKGANHTRILNQQKNQLSRLENLDRAVKGEPPLPVEDPDLPAGGGGVDASLLPLTPPPADLQMPPIDYTEFNKSADEAAAVRQEAYKALEDEISGIGRSAQEAYEAAEKLFSSDDLSPGDSVRQGYADYVRTAQESAAAAAAAAADGAAQSVATAQAATAAKIELSNEERKAAMRAALDMALARHEAAEAIKKADLQTYGQLRSANRDVVTDIVSSWATGTGKISDIVSQWANSMIKQFIQLSLFGNTANGGSIGGLLGAAGGTSGGTSGWAGAIGTLVGGFFADGGRPPMGKISVVGERGPELFVPDSAGRIIPNHQAAAFSAGSGGGPGGAGAHVESPMIFNISQTFTTGVTMADLAGAMDQMQDATRAGVLEAVRRGGGFRRGIQA